MRVFQAKVFDGQMSGTGTVYTQTAFSDLLGSAERITLGAIVNGLSGTGPTITIQFENSPDGTRWVNQFSSPEINGQGLSDGIPFISTNLGSRTIPIPNHVRLRISLGGTSPAGHLRIWVVGRSPAF